MTNETLKIFGYSEGDPSVGIGSREFEIDTGIEPEDVSKEDREYIIETMIRDMWELHDNGILHYNFSDEIDNDGFMNYKDSDKILKERGKK